MVEKYTTDTNEEIICQDLTYGFLLGIQEGSIEETKHDVVMNGTGLSKEELYEYRSSEVTDMYNIVIRLTYPDLFDENGNQLPVEEDVDEVDDKKKA